MCTYVGFRGKQWVLSSIVNSSSRKEIRVLAAQGPGDKGRGVYL